MYTSVAFLDPLVLFGFIIQIIIPVAASVALFLLQKKTRFGAFSFLKSQIIIGVIFGFIACCATSFGVDTGTAVLNVRDAGPICAGLIFGWPAAIISGVIGGVFRLLVTCITGAYAYTVVACTIATICAGVFTAVVKRYVLDEKHAPWYMGLIVALVIEAFHMLLVSATHMDDVETAFGIIREVAIPMIIGNAAAVTASTAIVKYLSSREKYLHKKRPKALALTFQKWLLVVIGIAAAFSFEFTFLAQSNISNSDASTLLTNNINNTINDVIEQTDSEMLNKCRTVKYSVDERSEITADTLEYLSGQNKVAEIAIVDNNGIITASNVVSDVGYDMSSDERSAEFLCLLDDQEKYVQDIGPKATDPSTRMKYVGMSLAQGGFVLVGYNEDMYRNSIQQHIEPAAKNRTIRETGYLVICYDDKIVSAPTMYSQPQSENDFGDEYDIIGQDVSVVGVNLDDIKANDEMTMFTTPVVPQKYSANMLSTDGKVMAYSMYSPIENYTIIGFLPTQEVLVTRDLFEYLSVFIQVVVFGVVFIVVYFLINKNVVQNIKKVNDKLDLIIAGNLDVELDIINHDEFESLSNGINHTVARLRGLISEANERIDNELAFARGIQLSALPNIFPAYPGREDFDIFASMCTAKEVGGDFYDFYLLDDNHLVILIADVSGKGIPAAMFMMTAKTLLKGLAETGKEVQSVVTDANAELCANNDKGMFITMWMGVADLRTGDVVYVNAGHNPPIIIKADGTAEYLHSKAGFVLAGMDGIKYRKNTLKLEDGDKIYLYTDGITEAMDINQELYGEQRLLDVATEFGRQDATSFCHIVSEKVSEFVGDAPQADDMTMLCYEFKGEADTISDGIELDAVIENVDVLTEFVNNMLDKAGCSPKAKVQIDVAIDELFSNIAYYAYRSFNLDEPGKAVVTVSITGDTASLSFVDGGVEFNPLKKRDPNVELTAEERKIGGLGIYMVKKSMDNMTYTRANGFNMLTICKKIKGQ